ncbi:MAG: cell surface glycoprotein related protein [Dehalococcoidales bacterium]|nr:cell surface glycoprotein related protein [Dehalococcoidales bacterium]
MKGLLLGIFVGFGLLLISSMVACAQPAPAPIPAPTPSPTPAPTPAPAPVLPVPAKFAVSSLTVSPSVASTDELVAISVVVSNAGGLPGSYSVTLKIDNLRVATKDVTVAGGASENVSFTTRKFVAKEYAVDVNGLSGRLVVKQPAIFSIPRISVVPGNASPDEEVTISATVTNSGGSGIYAVIFKVNGTEETRKEVTLDAGDIQNVSYKLSKTVAGTYNVDVNGIIVQFTVTASRTLVFKDLAYIRAVGVPYSDDADPEWEGVSVSVSYYGLTGDEIIPSGVSNNVTVELYWSPGSPSIYHKEVIMDSSSGFKREVVRIPFDAIPKRPIGLPQDQRPILDVEVATPTQGKFADRSAEMQYWPPGN